MFIIYSILLFLAFSMVVLVPHRNEVTAASYFFANHNVHWFTITMSIMSGLFIGFVSMGLIPGGVFENPLVFVFTSIFLLIVIALFVIPTLFKQQIKTVPQFIERRFGNNRRYLLSGLYILFNSILRLFIILIISNIFLNKIFNINPFSPLLFLLIVTGGYVIFGGLRAELYAGALQFVLFLIGSVISLGWIFQNKKESDWLLRSIDSFRADIGFYSISIELVFGILILVVWFWCADHFVMPKINISRSLSDARKSIGLCIALLVLLSVFFTIGFVWIPIQTFSYDFFNSDISSNTMPLFVNIALIIAVSAAFMSAYASVFNNTSLVVAYEFYSYIKPDASDREMVFVGRLTNLALLILSILLLPIAQSIDIKLCVSLTNVFLSAISMITALFLISLISNSPKKIGHSVVLLFTTTLIILHFIFELIYARKDTPPIIINWFAKINTFEFMGIVFGFTIISIALIELFERGQYLLHRLKIQQK